MKDQRQRGPRVLSLLTNPPLAGHAAAGAGLPPGRWEPRTGAGMWMQPGKGTEDPAGPTEQVLEVTWAMAPPGAARASQSQSQSQRRPGDAQGSPARPRPAEAQPHSPSPSSSSARSAPPSLLGRLSPARSDLSITRSLLSRDRSLGGQEGGDKALREDHMQGANGDKVCLRATRGGEGEARAVPEQHGGRGLRGPGRREPAQDGPGAGPASVTRAPWPWELPTLSPATLGPGRDAGTGVHSLQHVQMLLQEGDGGCGAAADVLVGEPHELAGEGHEVAGGLPVVLQRASRGGAQPGLPQTEAVCPVLRAPLPEPHSAGWTPAGAALCWVPEAQEWPCPRPAGAPPGGRQLGAWPCPRPPAARGSALLQGSLEPHLPSPSGFCGQTPSPGKEDRACCSCGNRGTNRLGREFRMGGRGMVAGVGGGLEVGAERGRAQGRGTHPQQAHEGEQAVPQRPLVLALEHLRLQQLQDPQHMHEEGQVVLLPELLEVEMRAAVQEGGDHGQVPAAKPEPPGPGRPPASPLPSETSSAGQRPPRAHRCPLRGSWLLNRLTRPRPPGLACQQAASSPDQPQDDRHRAHSYRNTRCGARPWLGVGRHHATQPGGTSAARGGGPPPASDRPCWRRPLGSRMPGSRWYPPEG